MLSCRFATLFALVSIVSFAGCGPTVTGTKFEGEDAMKQHMQEVEQSEMERHQQMLEKQKADKTKKPR
ncbi:hypothetical protein GC163_23285 [bacterium]|nr:hypothetical protein [bacterium]